MDKTVHKKLTDKYLYRNSLAVACADEEDLLASMKQEMKILQCAAQDLLQPRSEAIASILEKAKAL